MALGLCTRAAVAHSEISRRRADQMAILIRKIRLFLPYQAHDPHLCHTHIFLRRIHNSGSLASVTIKKARIYLKNKRILIE
jgi:hypothetical protein